MIEDKEPDSPYGIICSIHGKQGLTKENYELQMSLPDNLWMCPIQDCEANFLGWVRWDDDRYEASEGFVDEDPHFGNDPLPDEDW